MISFKSRNTHTNFQELVCSTSPLSDNLCSKIVQELKDNFNTAEKEKFVANFYMYLHYDPEKDYPINLEDVFTFVGFSTKGSAKRSLKNNFTENEDYIVNIDNIGKPGKSREDVMLNTNTFKMLCMITKTEQGKAIRKYYIKMENIYNSMIKKQNDELIRAHSLELQTKDKILQEYTSELQKKDEELQNASRLADERGKIIKDLEEQNDFSYLYIGITNSLEDTTKIGISKDQIDISSDEFIFLHTYRSKMYKNIIKTFRHLARPYACEEQNGWYNMTFDEAKQIFDFSVMIHEDFKISTSKENLLRFAKRFAKNKPLVHIKKWFFGKPRNL